MQKYFEQAYQAFFNIAVPLAESTAEIAKVAFVYVTFPVWIIPYAIRKELKKRSVDNA